MITGIGNVGYGYPPLGRTKAIFKRSADIK